MLRTIFQAHLICLALVGAIYDNDFYDLSTLGQRITQDVNRRLAPLHDLGPRIAARVNADLEPITSGRLSQSINRDVRRNLAPLDNLGEQIQQNVYEGLAPVRALELQFKMKDGVGGTTVATYLPEGKKFIIRNRQLSLCSGSISADGQCSGTLTPFKVNGKHDYCYFGNNYSQVNNQICLGASSVSVINNVIRCESSTGTPALLISVDEFSKLCEDAKTVEYKYIADPNDPAHVQIPNSNAYVKCENNQPGVCVFTETRSWPAYSASTIIING